MSNTTEKAAKNTLTFTVFSDLHYKKGMYIAGVKDLEAIIDRAAKNQSDFLLHSGDLCNDYFGSPELTKAFLQNQYHLPVYGIYGNHELEGKNDCMQTVTPMLTNCADHVVWGTPSEKIENGLIAYYYFDTKGFRIICTDTNYSYNPQNKLWEHNPSPSYGPPKGNIYGDCLGDIQLAWLENVLLDAAEKHLSCIVVSHAGFSGVWNSSQDWKKVQALFKAANAKTPKTVMLAINGHYHQNHAAVVDHVLYLDIHSVFNGVWRLNNEQHYKEGQTFAYTDYDKTGTPVKTFQRNLTDLSMGKHTYFFNDPLSAVIKITPNGIITIKGTKTSWRYNVVPKEALDDLSFGPEITSRDVTI